MRIRVFQSIEDDIFKLTFTQDLSELSTDDQRRLNRYGEPDINFGGTFEYPTTEDTLALGTFGAGSDVGLSAISGWSTDTSVVVTATINPNISSGECYITLPENTPSAPSTAQTITLVLTVMAGSASGATSFVLIGEDSDAYPTDFDPYVVAASAGAVTAKFVRYTLTREDALAQYTVTSVAVTTAAPVLTQEFTLPDTYAKIVSGLPKTIEFDSKAGEFSTNTVTKLDAYRDTIIALMESEMEDLRAITDTWTSEKLFTV